MILKRVSLSNIRGVTSLDWKLSVPDKARPGWTVLAGRNGTGKTTVLQAIAATLIGRENALQILSRADQFIRLGENDGRSDVWVEPVDEDLRTGAASGSLRLGIEWSQSGGASYPPRGARRIVDEHLWNTTEGASKAGWCLIGLGSSRFSAPEGEVEPTGSHRRDAVVSLFRRDISLQAAHRWVMGIGSLGRPLVGPDTTRVPRRVLELLLADGLLSEDGSKAGIQLGPEGLSVRRGEGMIPLASLGQGFESAVLVVTEIVRQMAGFFGSRFMGGLDWQPPVEGSIIVPHSGIVLIDEVENHLHPQLQQHIGFWLKAHFPAVQFIVTTHSPFICQAADEGCLFQVGEAGSVKAVSSEVFRSVVNGSVDDAVVTELFGLPSAYSNRSMDLRDELSDIESRILDGSDLSAAEKLRRDEILSQLPTDPNTEVERLVAALRSRN